MDIFTAIHERRSVRSFTEAPVTPEQIHILLEAAMAAPSAANGQPWAFLVVDDPALLGAMPAINPYASMVPKAPVAILVCGDLSKEKAPGYWIQDCSAAIQNMLLAVVGLGLGAVWTGIHPTEARVRACAELFHLPPTLQPLGLIAIGHPQKPGGKRESRFDPTKVRANRWQE